MKIDSLRTTSKPCRRPSRDRVRLLVLTVVLIATVTGHTTASAQVDEERWIEQLVNLNNQVDEQYYKISGLDSALTAATDIHSGTEFRVEGDKGCIKAPRPPGVDALLNLVDVLPFSPIVKQGIQVLNSIIEVGAERCWTPLREANTQLTTLLNGISESFEEIEQARSPLILEWSSLEETIALFREEPQGANFSNEQRTQILSLNRQISLKANYIRARHL